MKRHSEKGMALVITLMMLAIVTFMAVVFLSLSRRERANVKIMEDQATARMMADAAQDRAKADLTATMSNEAQKYLDSANAIYGNTNDQKHIAIANRAIQRALYAYDLRASKNFFNPAGFKRSDKGNPWNVSYYDTKNIALVPGTDDYYQNIANLQYDPRPPVIVSEGTPKTNDFRYYIDLNRNGIFDGNDVYEVTGPNNERYTPNGKIATAPPYLLARFSGDPEWIGVLERPDLPHSETNRFIGRYAYIMLPTGKSLDINFIHNLAVFNSGDTNLTYGTGKNPRFSRNQGVGSWELNMAAFLVDFHTNVWKPNTTFYRLTTTEASGLAFKDAVGLLQYRLNYSRGNLLTPQAVFGAPANWARDYVDMAGDGPFIPYQQVYTSARPIFDGKIVDDDQNARFWHGVERIDKTGEFADVQRYFKLSTPSATSEQLDFYGKFTDAVSSKRTNTYDRFAYYRLLAQMGADSMPALRGKIHLNFANEPGSISTNLVSWVTITNNNTIPTLLRRTNTAVLVKQADGGEQFQTRTNTLTNFFLIAADAMLRESLVTNVYVDNFGKYRTNYTIGCTYFDNPALNAVWQDPTRVRRIVTTPVRPDISVTNIQIYHRPNIASAWRPNDNTYTNAEYTAEVHRILQVAANIYDNMTNSPGRTGKPATDPFFPTVWRPLYNITQTNITIVGWEPQENAAFALRQAQTNASLFRSPRDYFTGTNVALPIITNVSFYGQPWVIGVKKGWPNFNEFSIETFAQVTRKLEVFKEPALAGKAISLTNFAELAAHTKQIYLLGLSNSVGIEAWNSYARTNDRKLRIDAEIETQVGIDRVLTRDPRTRAVLTSTPAFVNPRVFIVRTNQSIQPWYGRQSTTPTQPLNAALPANGKSDFHVPLYSVFTVLTNSEYSELPGPIGTFFAKPAIFQSLTNTPDFQINVTNRIRYLVTDEAENRVIDYVTLDNLVTKVDLDEAMRGSHNFGNAVGGAGFDPAEFWDPTPEPKSQVQQGVSHGVMRQLEASLDILNLSTAQWADYSAFARVPEEISKFYSFMYGTNAGAMKTNLAAQVPFTPSRLLYLISRYQANDPLVHYMETDLRDPLQTTRPMILKLAQRVQNDELGLRNKKRQAMRIDGLHGISFQDPRITESDDWQFPIARLDNGTATPAVYGITNFNYRYPNIGALGQIHRGTPWQTVYLKAAAAVNMDPTTLTTNVPTWVRWAGSYATHPTNDWKLVGLFTTAMSENAARGLLSVNQSHTAAWSAVLSGVPVITNSVKNTEMQGNPKALHFGDPNAGDQDLMIQPASTQLSNIVRNINQYRATRPMGSFSYLGEILGTPMLSVGNNLNNGAIQASPYLNISAPQIQEKNVNGVVDTDWHAFTDEALEAIPQRILSLLKEDEARVTIYCFGQTLKPAARSFITSADFYNLCVNYQVTGEYVTKAVVRVEGELNPTDWAIENDKSIPDAQKKAWREQQAPLKTVVESFEVLAPFE